MRILDCFLWKVFKKNKKKVLIVNAFSELYKKTQAYFLRHHLQLESFALTDD